MFLRGVAIRTAVPRSPAAAFEFLEALEVHPTPPNAC
jgi:hypothetical protein